MTPVRRALHYERRSSDRRVAKPALVSLILLAVAALLLLGAEDGRRMGGFSDEGPFVTAVCSILCVSVNVIGVILATAPSSKNGLRKFSVLTHTVVAALALCYLLLS